MPDAAVPVILDFEKLTDTTSYVQNINNFAPGYAGFTWNNNWVVLKYNFAPYEDGYYKVMNSLDYVAANVSCTMLEITRSARFDVISLFMALSGFGTTQEVKLEGYRGGSLVGAQTVSLTKERSFVEPGFSDIDQFLIVPNSSCNGVGAWNIAIDDISVFVSD